MQWQQWRHWMQERERNTLDKSPEFDGTNISIRHYWAITLLLIPFLIFTLLFACEAMLPNFEYQYLSPITIEVKKQGLEINSANDLCTSIKVTQYLNALSEPEILR